MTSLAVYPVLQLPAIQPGDPLARCLYDAIGASGLQLETGDVVAICQKVVSKSEGRVVNLQQVVPSERARRFAEAYGRDPRLVEVVLRESQRVVRMERGLIISETATGLVCANAGVDQSNAYKPGYVTLLPSDPDASAKRIGREIRALAGIPIGIVVTDTFGRPWREGLVDVAIGIAGLRPLLDFRGTHDLAGRPLEVTVLALADQVAAAAGLVMAKGEGIAAAIVRGVGAWLGEGRASDLVRPAEKDLFR